MAREAPPQPSGKYERRIAESLSRVLADPETETVALDVDTARVVLFSDHHRGVRDGADDFLRCERAYNAALGYYLEQGYTLAALGDVEELWENDPEAVLAAYPQTLELETQFHAQGRYFRLWGNHDDMWRWAGPVDEHLATRFPSLRAREGLRLQFTEGGEPLGTLLLAHGHQGTADAGPLAPFNRFVVRYLWRPLQRRLNIPSTTPARDWSLRKRHEAAMFAWARVQDPGLVLVTGHTHRPVFGESKPDPKTERSSAVVRAELDAARAAQGDPRSIATLRAELEFAVAEEQRTREQRPLEVDPPCYFNTGCCSFGDGDVTGLEIADGEIRLVRWPDREERPLPAVLATADLRDVLRRVAGTPS